MSADARKRQKHRLKRQRKRSSQLRQTRDPYRDLDKGELAACYINRGWREDGMISLHLLRRRPGGACAMAAFLIDPWCMGLKDAYGEPEITATAFQERVLDRLKETFELERVDPATVRRLVAGGIRFAHQNGFRLPPRYERWLAVLGDIGDWHTADLSDFGVEGGRLRFVGDLNQLRRRLIGCSVEQFMARPDVEFIAGFESDVLAEEGAEELEDMLAFEDDLTEAFDTVREQLLQAVRRWCFANQIVPSGQLEEALRTTLSAAEAAGSVEPDEADDLSEETLHEGSAVLESAIAGRNSDPEFMCAMRQVSDYMQQFPSAEAMLASVGLLADE